MRTGICQQRELGSRELSTEIVSEDETDTESAQHKNDTFGLVARIDDYDDLTDLENSSL